MLKCKSQCRVGVSASLLLIGFGVLWQNEWVICRVFKKSLSGKKTCHSGIMRLESLGNEMSSSILPPLTNSSPYSIDKIKSPYVSCFSNPIERNQVGIFDSFNNTPFEVPSNHSINLPKNTPSIGSFYSTQGIQVHPSPNLPLHGSVYNNGSNFENQHHPPSSTAPIDLSTLWNY